MKKKSFVFMSGGGKKIHVALHHKQKEGVKTEKPENSMAGNSSIKLPSGVPTVLNGGISKGIVADRKIRIAVEPKRREEPKSEVEVGDKSAAKYGRKIHIAIEPKRREEPKSEVEVGDKYVDNYGKRIQMVVEPKRREEPKSEKSEAYKGKYRVFRAGNKTIKILTDSKHANGAESGMEGVADKRYKTFTREGGGNTRMLTGNGMLAGQGQYAAPFSALSVQPVTDMLPEIVEIEGIALPLIKTIKTEEMVEETVELQRTDIRYPLIPYKPKKGDRIYSSVHIFFDNKLSEPVYYVEEPGLDTENRMLLERIKEYVQEKTDINFGQIRKVDAVSYLVDLFNKALSYLSPKLDPKISEILKYYVIRDFMGLEIIEPLLNDKQIEDISCDGVNIPIYVYHRDPRFGSLRTNIQFSNKEDLDSFVNKLAERCGRTISVANPLLDGTLPDGSRVQTTLSSDIARRGSNFTIRLFTENPMTPIDIINFGTCDIKMMAYFWFLIEHGSSFLVSGGTATGKTSILNALSMFIKPQMKIVSIEDTAELKLPHSHWVPEVARTPISEEGKVDMFELLRESLRQRPDYIIVGEVRGKEVYVLFQQMAVGHPGLSTIHAESFNKLLDRLTSPPIELPANLLQSLDAVLFVKRVKKDRKYIRRINSVTEIVDFDERIKKPVINELFKWNPKTDTFPCIGSHVLKKISNNTGMSAKEIQEDIRRKATVIEWMRNSGIRDYRKIGAIINLFYASPDFLLERIEGGI